MAVFRKEVKGLSRNNVCTKQVQVCRDLNVVLERFSFECRKVIGFAFTSLRDWLTVNALDA